MQVKAKGRKESEMTEQQNNKKAKVVGGNINVNSRGRS